MYTHIGTYIHAYICKHKQSWLCTTGRRMEVMVTGTCEARASCMNTCRQLTMKTNRARIVTPPPRHFFFWVQHL